MCEIRKKQQLMDIDVCPYIYVETVSVQRTCFELYPEPEGLELGIEAYAM